MVHFNILCLCVFVCACVFKAKGFELSYLEKVPEVKDTVHKQSLLHHVCSIVVDKFPESSDLYSEIGAITRSAKVLHQIRIVMLIEQFRHDMLRIFTRRYCVLRKYSGPLELSHAF